MHSELIRQCKDGVVANPYQGSDKKVLFVCFMGILRSATGARIYAKKYNTRAVGVAPDSLIRINQTLVDWADEIVFVTVDVAHSACKLVDIEGKTIKVLSIPDDYDHMDPELVKAFEEQYDRLT